MVANSLTKQTKHYLCEIIMILLMLCGFFIPTGGALPPYGMQILWIFLGLLFGWSTVGLIVPSLLGLVALAFTDGFTMVGAWAAGIGSEIIILLLLFGIFSKWLEKVGLTNTLVNWFLSRKCFQGKPWLFITCFLLLVYLLGLCTSVFPAILIGWSCAYKLCDILGYEKRSPFCAFMIFNITVNGSMGDATKPWSSWGLATMNAYHSVVEQGSINYSRYMLWCAAIYLTIIVLAALFGKFVLSIDVGPFLKGDYRQAAAAYHFDRTQKFACGLLIAMVIGLFLPEYLPACALKSFLNTLGAVGIITVILFIAGAINTANGQPFMDFNQIASHGGVPWEPIMLLIVTIPLGAALKSPEAGVMQIASDLAIRHIGNLSPIVFYIVIAIILGCLTQVAHNLVLLASFAPMFAEVGMSLGMSPEVIIMTSSIMLTAALGSPAGSTRSGMLYGNTAYIKMSDSYKLGWLSLLAHLVVCCGLGIPLAMLIF